MSRLTEPEIRARVAALGPWFHNLDLAGVRTAPDHFLYDYPEVKWRRFRHAIPERLDGRTVLDIGCNAGFYALEMKRRGASRVVAIDTDERYLAQARLASDVIGLELELRNLSAYDVASLGERFDIVLFMGVFYHLRHPLLALDLLHEHVAKDLVIFQTLQRGPETEAAVEADYDFFETAHFEAPDYPRMNFIEHRYAGDWTNWWAPNAAGAMAMLRSAGFAIVDRPEAEVYLCRRVERPTAAGAVYPAHPSTGAQP